MKKLIQHINDGKIELIDCPNPAVEKQEILCETKCSLISSGTERMLLDFGKSNFFIFSCSIFPFYTSTNSKYTTFRTVALFFTFLI